MERKIVWSHAAAEDLEAGAEYIHRDSPAYAASFVQKTFDVVRSLNQFAERGRIVPEFGGKNIREISTFSADGLSSTPRL